MMINSNKKFSIFPQWRTFIMSAIFIFTLFSCSSFRYSKNNLAHIYNFEKKISAEFIPFHYKNSGTTIYFKINSSSLLFVKPNSEDISSAKLKINCKLLKDYSSKIILDSSSFVFNILSSGTYFIDSFNINIPEPDFYLLNIKLTDLNRKYSDEYFVRIDRSDDFSNQNFLIKDINNIPVFRNFLNSLEKCRVYINNPNISAIQVKHYNKEFPVALPVFSEYKQEKYLIKPDTTFYIPIKNQKSDLLSFTKKGIYFFQLNNESKKGFTILRFYDDFPEITNPYTMLYPLTYITTKSEFDKILFSKNKKAYIDEFWLNLASNPQKAKELIKRYYTRVKEANIMFSSYIEGWKTDMGMVYIIFGKPNLVFRSYDAERWVYGALDSPKSINFYFYKVQNPFSDNDFSLNRNPNYKNNWYMAVETWRR